MAERLSSHLISSHPISSHLLLSSPSFLHLLFAQPSFSSTFFFRNFILIFWVAYKKPDDSSRALRQTLKWRSSNPRSACEEVESRFWSRGPCGKNVGRPQRRLHCAFPSRPLLGLSIVLKMSRWETIVRLGKVEMWDRQTCEHNTRGHPRS